MTNQPYQPYETITQSRLRSYLTEEEELVMSNLADIAYETIISQNPDFESIYDVVLDIQDPSYKESVQSYVERHREFINGNAEYDKDATDTENYFHHLMEGRSWPEATLLLGTDFDVSTSYEEAKNVLGVEPNALSLLAAVTHQ